MKLGDRASVGVRWYNQDNTIIGIGNSILVSPTVNTHYRVEVTYSLCARSVTVSDQIKIQFSQDYPTANNVFMPFANTPCVKPGELAEVDLTSYEPRMNNTPGLSFSYYTSLDAANKGGETGKILDPRHYKIFIR